MLRAGVPQGRQIDTVKQALARTQQDGRDGDVHFIH